MFHLANRRSLAPSAGPIAVQRGRPRPESTRPQTEPPGVARPSWTAARTEGSGSAPPPMHSVRVPQMACGRWESLDLTASHAYLSGKRMPEAFQQSCREYLSAAFTFSSPVFRFKVHSSRWKILFHQILVVSHDQLGQKMDIAIISYYRSVNSLGK